MTFRQNISKFAIGEIDLHSMPAIAFQALEQGLDTPSLRILAGLSEDENEYVIRQYFNDTLKEMSIELPEIRQAAIEAAITIAGEIFKGNQKIFEGVQDIIRKALDAFPFREESKHFCYDSIGFAKAFGLFDTLEDLRDSGSTRWQDEKTNEELEQELNAELLEELKFWAASMKPSNP
ncbi:MAG: hypothetical protein ABI378_06395 [Chitinophagaceae bacterium]